MSIIVDRISCARQNRTLFAHISFSVSQGNCLILRGPNGVGKSTLLRILAGFAALQTGTCTIDTEEVAYLGHLDAVKGHLSVTENLAFWADIYGSENISEIMQLFHFEGVRDVLAGKLSAGQKRRLGLARILLSGRQIWLLDEPTTSLDANHSALITQMICAHCAKGGLAVIATHIDLDIPGAITIDLSDYVPDQTNKTSPFLEGNF